MTEKRYKSIGANLECPNGMEYMLIKRNDGFNVCQVCSKYTAKEIVDELNSLADENEQLRKDATTLIYANQDYRHENEHLKSENKRLSDKLNETSLEFLNYNLVTMGKATEISEMCYSDFLKYRKENGNPMELQE